MSGLGLVVLAAPTREGLAARAAGMADDVRALTDHAVHVDDVEPGEASRSSWRAVALGRDPLEQVASLRALSRLGAAPGTRSGRPGRVARSGGSGPCGQRQ